jgi:membrane protein DedA with SNARE-associated domain
LDLLLEHGLLAVLAALLLAPLGLPIPEEISLMAAGAYARSGRAPLELALLVGYTGIVGGDCIAYGLGRRVGLHPKGVIGRLFGHRRLRRIVRFYDRFGVWTVVLCRQIPGMRFPAFFFSGASGMSLRKFLFLDGTAAIGTALLWVGAGWWLGPRLAESMSTVDNLRQLGLGLGVALIALFAWRIFREPKATGRPVTASPGPPTD